jgi:hypothetical protein
MEQAQHTQTKQAPEQGAGFVYSSNSKNNVLSFSNLSSTSDEGIYFKLYRLFIEKLKINFCPIRLAPFAKNPIDTGWTSDDYDPTPIGWTRHNGNIGIIPGRSNLIIIDCDTEESIKFFEDLAKKIGLSLDTLIVKTRRGRHYYYYCPYSADLEKKQFSDATKNIKIDLLAGNKCQGVGPFSMLKLDNQGNILKKDAKEFILFVYEPVNIPDALPEITPDLFNSLIGELEKTLQKTKETKEKTQTTSRTTTTQGEERELTDEEIEQIINIILEYFVEGQRQNFVLFFAGMLRKDFNVSIESIHKLYQRLEEIDDKRDIKYRYEAIERTFKKDIDEIAGRKELARIIGEEKTDELYNKIKQILNIPIEKPKKNKTEKEEEIPHEENNENFLELLGIQNVKPEENTEKNKFIYIEISKKSKKYARCDFKEKIIEYGQFKKDERTEEYFYEVHSTVFDCCIDKIYAVENPITKETSYEIHFTSKIPVESHKVFKGTLNEIWENLKTNTSYVLQHGIALQILTATFNYYLKKGWFERKKEDLKPGFYYFDGEIIAQGFEEKTYTKEDLQQAAVFLNKYIQSHPSPQKIASIIKAGLLLPFSFAQKQAVTAGELRQRMRYLYLTGETKSGKTTTAMLLSKIWGTENKISYSSFNTEPRAATQLSQSTFILLVDEVSKDLESSSVKELLKFAQEDIFVRTILTKTHKQVHYLALSGLIMTSNSHFPEDIALLQRFYVFRFRKSDKISAKDRAKYEKEDFNCLWPLGQFVYQYVKAHGLRDNYIIYTWEILKAFYEEAQVEAEWINWPFQDDTSETEEEEEYRKEMDFFTALQKFLTQNVKTEKGQNPAQAIYTALKERHFSRWIWCDENYIVYITNDFLLELQKFYRSSIRCLEELKEITGWTKMFKRCYNTRIRVLQTTVMDLFYRLNLIPELLSTTEFHEWINNRLQINFSEKFVIDDTDLPEEIKQAFQ